MARPISTTWIPNFYRRGPEPHDWLLKRKTEEYQVNKEQGGKVTKHLERHEETSGNGKLINKIGLSKFAG